jgi:hypothetical protein
MMIQKKLKTDADAKDDEDDEDDDEGEYQPPSESDDDSAPSAPSPPKKRKQKKQGGGKKKKPRKAKAPPAKKKKEKEPKDSDSETESSEDSEDSDDSDGGGKLIYKEKARVSKVVEKANVQRALKKLRTSERDKNQMALSRSFDRCERAKLGTFTCFEWMQMVAKQVRGQRGKVVATVKGIVKKCDIFPNAMVSCMYI